MKTYIQKIDSKLLSSVQIQNEISINDFVECIIYVNDFDISKHLLMAYKNQSVQILHEYPFIKAFGVKVSKKILKELANLSQTIFISSQNKIFAQVATAKKIINTINISDKKLTGKDVCVAIIDTGISNHIDFLFPKNRIKHFEDFINGRKNIYDDNGHGTLVAGVLGGSGIYSEKKYAGVAPNVNFVILKCLDSAGQTTTLEMLNAMQWVYSHKEKFGIDIVCMSFGATLINMYDPLIKGAESLWDAGIVAVVAAGNSGPAPSTINSPGASSKVITVGALDDGRNQIENFENASFVDLATRFSIPDFSSRGPAFNVYKPDLLTSGVDVVGASKDLSYAKMTGTSVATPIVAGVCALLLENYNKQISPNQTKELLLNSCTSLKGDRNEEGYGYLRF